MDNEYNVYEDIKKKLMEKGVPENEIAFIHDANTELRKAELFGKVRCVPEMNCHSLPTEKQS